MHAGDGTFYKTNRGLVWEIRGDLKEKEYYLDNIKQILESVFKLEFIPKLRGGGKNGCFGIQTSDKKVSSFFIKYGFLPGKKTHTVTIPPYIKDSDIETKLAFIRGYFDTDGYLRFERINKSGIITIQKLNFVVFLRD